MVNKKPNEMNSIMEMVGPIKNSLENTKNMIRDFQDQNQLALADIKLQGEVSANKLKNEMEIGEQNSKRKLREKLQRRDATRDRTEFIVGDEPAPTLGGKTRRRRHKKTKNSHRKKGGRNTRKSHRGDKRKQKTAHKK